MFVHTAGHVLPYGFPLVPVVVVVQNKRDQKVHLIIDDLAIVEVDLLFLDPGASDMSNRLIGTVDSMLNRVLKALG